jgi:hypothetical protein
MKKIPFLSLIINRNKFFDDIKTGEIFTFSTSFDILYVIKIARNRGVTVEYCKAGSPEDLKYGSRTMKVIRNKLNDSQIFHFDTKYLDT